MIDTGLIFRLSFLFLATHLLIVTSSSYIVDLNADNFYDYVKSERLLFVQFYAPWCGHCKSIATNYDNAAAKLQELQIQSTIAQLDGSHPSVEELLVSEKVDGYPTFLLYKNGRRLGEYYGNRTDSDFVDYIQRKSIPAAKRISSELELVPAISALDRTDQFQQGILGVVIGLFPNDQELDGPEARLYEAVADRCDFAHFFVSNSPNLIGDFKVTAPSIVVFSADNRDIYHTITFNDRTSEDQIIDEIMILSMPLSLPMNSDMISIISALPVMHALTFYDSNGDDERFLDAVASVMPEFKGKIVMIEISSDEYNILHNFGIESTADLPQLVLVDPSAEGGGRRFSFADYLRTFHQQKLSEGEEYEEIEHNLILARTENVQYSMWVRPIAKADDSDRLLFNATLIAKFFATFLEDSSAQSLNSQDLDEIAKLNEMSPVNNLENLASSQFESRVVQDASTDSFVFFHAPWCIHCKAMEAMMVELAQHYDNDPTIAFFRIDAQKNEIGHQSVKLAGLPSMYLFPADDKLHPVFFDENRTLRDFIDFIELHRRMKNEQLSEHIVEVTGD